MKISKTTLKALKIVRDNAPITCRRFAEIMWENSPAWHRHYNTGNGATIGKGMWLSAGSYLRKLERAKLIQRSWMDYHEYQIKYSITDEGIKSLGVNNK